MRFVDYIVKYLEDQEIDLKHLAIVLPSERMKKYLSEALVRNAGKPMLAPEMITMDQWVRSLSKRTVIDSTRALLRLFEIQLEKAETEEDRSFDEFLNWGTTLLSDFNEIDRYLLDAKQVFRNLASIKEIENWSFGNETLTPSQKRFMEFWDRLPAYYYALNEKLDSDNQCYMGGAYKALANDIQPVFREDSERHFLFAGFNALSEAEKSIVRQLINYGRGHYLIDADAFYLNKKTHEAGAFLRDISSYLNQPKMERTTDELSTKRLEVDVIECVQNTGQVKVAASKLEQLSETELNDTLLLLADETLISAMVKNLPKSIGKANISLGLPIRNTFVKTWVDLMFSIQENKTRFKTRALYFQDLQSFWNHPLVLAVCSPEEKSELLKLEKEIIENNRIFVNAETVQNKTSGVVVTLIEILTLDWNSNWSLAMGCITKLNRLIYGRLEKEMAFERAILQCFDAAITDVQNLVAEGLPEMHLRSFKLMFNQHWSRKSIAYHGNPIDGLQIMGMLETRGLDFKRIICLGMNEGQLPPTNPIQTLIPMDLRRFHGLPSPREKQGIFAHHFYRLLHACEDLTITYTSADESIGSNEPSRYLMQIEMELARINPNILIQKQMYALNSRKEEVAREIHKTPEIIARLDELFEASTSASMLKKYLTCPLDFYFRYVMDFGESIEVEEELETSTFGTFIHNTLEVLYQPFAQYGKDGKAISPAPSNITSYDIDKMLKDYKLILHQEFLKHFNGQEDSFLKGKNLLSYKMAMDLTARFLKSERDFLMKQTEPVFIEALEREFESTVEINVHGSMKKVRLRGIIDRIDSIGDRVRIVDYKTGRVSATDVELRRNDATPEEVVETMTNKKHVLQLIHYAYLYEQSENKPAQPTIISLVSAKSEPFALDLKSIPFDEGVAAYPQYIQQILEEIYNTEIPFVHQSKGPFSYCKYCD